MRLEYRALAFLFEQFREQYFDRGRAYLSQGGHTHGFKGRPRGSKGGGSLGKTNVRPVTGSTSPGLNGKSASDSAMVDESTDPVSDEEVLTTALVLVPAPEAVLV